MNEIDPIRQQARADAFNEAAALAEKIAGDCDKDGAYEVASALKTLAIVLLRQAAEALE